MKFTEEDVEKLMAIVGPMMPRLTPEQLREHCRQSLSIAENFRDPTDAVAMKEDIYKQFPHLKNLFDQFFKE